MSDKTRKYLLYALGEISLVVIGILIALQVNNWNERRLIEQERQALILSLIDEMGTTVERMEYGATQMQAYLNNAQVLMNIIPEGGKGYETDSIRALFGGSFGLVTVHPELTTYNQAINSGRIGLIDNPEVLKYFTNIMIEKTRYDRHVNLGAQGFYQGSFWEIKKKLGDHRAVFQLQIDDNTVSKAFQLTETEFREFIATPEVYALVLNEYVLHQNLYNAFDGMKTNAEAIESELESMLED